MVAADVHPRPIRDARAQILHGWAARARPVDERHAERRAALLDRLLDSLASPEGAGLAAPTPRDADAVAETSATLRDLLALGSVLVDTAAARTRAPIDPRELAALAQIVDAAIERWVRALEVGAESALTRADLRVPEEGPAIDELDYVWEIPSGEMHWDDRRIERTVPIAPDLGSHRGQYLSHVHPEDRERFARTTSDAIDRGDELTWSEYRMRRNGGVWTDVVDRAVIVRENGRAVRAIGHIRERTMVRRLLRELEETQERLHDATVAGGVGTFRIDLELQTTVRDGTLNRMLGAASETTTQPRGSTLAWIHPADRDEVGRELERVAREGGSFSIDCRVSTRDGSTKWIRGRGRALPGLDGRPRYVTAAVIDVTVERALAEERERLLEDSRRAHAEAEAASRAKEEFLALVSHELRSPLSSIVGWIALLRAEELEGERCARGLEIVERNARKQLRLVDDLLDMSRILAGKLGLEMQAVDLGSIAAEAVQSWRPAALAKSIELAIDVGTPATIVLGDPDRLGQVISNLVGNAIKFTPPHGRVSVDVRRTDGMARIAVRDSGRGIPEDQLAHVFERFHQVDARAAGRAGGLGLGLALVKDLVERHGGTVRPESTLGRGTTMLVELPIRESA